MHRQKEVAAQEMQKDAGERTKIFEVQSARVMKLRDGTWSALVV